MKKLITSLLGVALIISSGCNSPGGASPGTSTTAQETSTLMPTRTQVPEGTSRGYQTACAEVETAIPPGFLSEGTIILMGSGEPNPLYSFSTSDNQLRDLGISAPPWFGISPDRKWIVQQIEVMDSLSGDFYPLELRFLSIDGRVDNIIQLDRQWDSHAWLGGDLFLVQDSGSELNSVYYNTSTGQTTEINITDHAGARAATVPPFDPTLTRAVFQQEEDSTGAISLVLWDIPGSRALWEIQTGDQWVQAEWSPDGSRFAVGVPMAWAGDPHYQLLIVDYDGIAKQVTHFRGGLSRPPEETIYFPQWSPDGRYIAFWRAESLAVFDTMTATSTDYCLPSLYPNGDYITWSPNSRQIAFEPAVDPADGVWRAVVLDISSARVVQIATGLGVVGWMTIVP